MAKQFLLSLLALVLASSAILADEALDRAADRAKKAGGSLKLDNGTVDQIFLDDAKATDEDVAAVVEALLKSKEKVAVRQVWLSPSHGDDALKSVAELKTVGFLCIRRSKVTDKGLAHLKPLAKLTTLRANEIAITDEGLKALSEVKSLEQLFIDKTKVTDEGLKHLAKLRLVILSVKGTKVTAEGAKTLKGVTVDR